MENKMSIAEIKGAIKFGRDAVATFKERGEEVPSFVYDRIIELMDMLMEQINE